MLFFNGRVGRVGKCPAIKGKQNLNLEEEKSSVDLSGTAIKKKILFFGSPWLLNFFC